MEHRIDHPESALARVAHELSQPLNAMLAAVRVLRTSESRAAVDRAGAIIERQTAYMRALVNGVLDDARHHRSHSLLRFVRIDVREVVTHVLDANEALCATHRLAVSAELPEAPVWVDGDAVHLEEILWNLMSNAVRHTPPGGRILVRVTPQEDNVVVAVRDSGRGLKPQEIRRIFGAFVQGECGTAEGLGLGLAVAWELARAHGGTMDVRSEGPGRGSEFRLVLPSGA